MGELIQLPRAVDLFSGARGWDVCDEELGIESVGVESEKIANATARAAGFLAIDADVRKLSPVGCGFVGGKKSPPCPTFSASGNGSGVREMDAVFKAMDRLYETGRVDYSGFSDVRTGLVLEPLRWALDLVRAGEAYRWIVMEQVPRALPVWERTGKVLEAVGYSVATGVLSAEQYGVPQVRKRAVLVASLDLEAKLPEPTHSRYYSRTPGKLDPGVRPWVSMAEALGWGLADRPSPTITGGGTATGGAEPIAKLSRYSNRPGWTRQRPATTVQGDPRLAAPGHRCMTDDCHPGRDPESMFAKAVRITVEEAAILQSFPANYPWQGNQGQQFLQVGNAIPPLLARAILKQVI